MISTEVQLQLSSSVSLNNNNLQLDSTNQVSQLYKDDSIPEQIKARLHVIDVTRLITSSDTVFNFTPPQDSICILYSAYRAFTLYLEYKNSALPNIASSIIVNNINSTPVITYNIENISRINNTQPVALVMSYGHIRTIPGEGSYIYVNNDSIGLIKGTECCRLGGKGVLGQYQYYNNTLLGIGDDTPDNLVNNTDVLADIKSYVNYGDTEINIQSYYESPTPPHLDPFSNPIWATFLTYSTKCDTLKSYLTTSDTTICAGEPLVLQVGGLDSYSYSWQYRGEVISNDTVLSIAPEHNMLYSILVSDTSGCSKTEIINIKVNPKPSFVTTVNNATCPNNNGSIVIDSLQGIAPPFRYKKDNGNWQTAPVYGYLPQGSYNISMLDTNGCTATQSVNIESINNSIANFSFANSLPFIPTEVVFENQSQNTSVYQWQVNGTTIDNTENLAYLFEQSGSYEITLIASLQNGVCADTTTKTITLNSENYFYIPTTFNGEINLFSNGYQSVSFSLVNALGQQVFSKTLAIHNSEQLIRNNLKIAKGVYFYQAEAVKNNGEVVVFGGKILF